MILYVISVIMYWLEIIKYAMILKLCFQEDIYRKWQLAAGMAAYLIGALFFSYDVHMLVICRFAIVSIAVLWGLEIKGWQRFAYTLFCLFEISCLDQIFCVIVESVHYIHEERFLEGHASYLVISIGTAMVLSLLWLIQNKWKNHFGIVSGAGVYIAVGVMGISMLLALAGLGEVNENLSDNRFSRICRILIPIAAGSVGLLGWLITYIKKLNDQLKNHLEVEQILNQTSENYYQLLQEKETDTKAFRHDMVSHMVCLHALLKNNDVHAAIEYIEKLQEQMREIQKKCYITGNQIIDAILNYYLLGLEKEIAIEVTGQCTKELKINNADLCTIVANLVQNAVEALKREESETPYLKIFIYTGIANMKLEICNSTQDKRTFIKGKFPESVKADRQNHGMGLRNVVGTISRNGGIIDIKKENGEFWATLTLPLKLYD